MSTYFRAPPRVHSPFIIVCPRANNETIPKKEDLKVKI